MLAGLRDILIISTPQDLTNFKRLFENGNHIGLRISYSEQKNPNGIAEAFIIGETFIGDDNVCLILGDNIFYGGGFTKLLRKSVEIVEKSNQALVFGYYVDNAERYGVVENDKSGNVLSIEEKPKLPKSNYAVVGLYFYPNSVNQIYLQNYQLKVELLDKDFTWLDSGTHESMLEASNYIHTIEKRKGRKVACIEEIAYVLGYICGEELKNLANPLQNNQYGKYLIEKVLKEK
jgi:glucose-1-phosphate thymidylyltransferase